MISREMRIASAALLGLLLAFLSFKVLRPFLISISWALVLAVVLAPVQRRLARRVRTPFWASFLTTAAAFLLVLIPLSFILAELAQEIVTAYPQLMEQVEAFRKGVPQGGSDLQVWIHRAEQALEQAGVELGKVAGFFAGWFTNLARGIFQNTFRFLFHLVFTLVFLFTFLRYGASIMAALRPLIPFRPSARRYLERKMEDFTLSLFSGVFLTALIQGALGAIGYLLFGLPSVLFLGTLTFVFALIPMGGATLVWGPLALLLIANGRTTAGILLLIYGAVFISGLDNVLRPLLVAGRGKVNPLFVLVGIVGGVAGMGMIGLLYGPITLYLAACVLQLLRQGPEADTA